MAAKKTKKKASSPKPSAAKKKPAAKISKKAKAKPAAKKKPAAKSAPQRKAPKSSPQIVHWEIQSQNPTLLHEFYAGAFGWPIDANNPMAYGMVTSGAGQGGINGGIGGSEGSGSRVVVYASVPDIVAVLARIEELGGKTIMPRADIGPVIMALYQDPEGNTMGLLER